MLEILNIITQLQLNLHNQEWDNPCYHNVNIWIMIKRDIHKGGDTGTLNRADHADKAF